MSDIILCTPIIHDEYTEVAEKMFDFPLDSNSHVIIKNNIHPPEEWNIGLIFGPSGSGKSTLLKSFGKLTKFEWDNRPIISNLNKVSPEEASKILCNVGFSTVPAWLRPYNCLSNGERFRADLARSIIENEELILIDEFTSVVDRNVAKSASNSLNKYIRNNNKKIILASCHDDIINWLQPDWIYNPNEGITHRIPRGYLQRPEIPIKIFRTKYEAWELFKHHHYLSSELNKSARCFMATWNNNPVAFTAILSLPHPKLKNSWRESRTVVLPDYQGLGIGIKLSDYFGSLIKAKQGRYFSKTIHPAMVDYRLKNKNKWKETTHSREKRSPSEASMLKRNWTASDRFCYAFEYIGEPSKIEESELFWEKC